MFADTSPLFVNLSLLHQHVLHHLALPGLVYNKPGAPSATCMSTLFMLIQMLSQGFCHQLNEIHDMLLFPLNICICMQHEEQLFSEHVQ